MQLVTLELEAFLPFKEHILLDFSAVNSDKIFLITGNTGSGKTSIFDAICYALYDEPSGSSRDNTHLKSQFADDSTKCFVKLCFENKGTRYTITRTPQQDRLKQTGNITNDPSTAVLELESGEIISAKREVNAKILEILGINAAQFKKIVMLPQGEFRKFLTDSSANKQTLLRHIFGTEYFDEFTDLLNAQQAEMRKKVDHIKVERDSFVGQIIALESENLLKELHSENRDYRKIIYLCDEVISTQNEHITELKLQLKSLSENLSALNLPVATSFNKKLSDYLSAKEKLAVLKSNKAQISEYKATVQKLFSVREVNLKREQMNSAKENATNFGLAVKEQAPLVKMAEQHFKTAQADYNSAFSQHEQISEKSVACEKLEQQLCLFTEQKKVQKSLNLTEKKLIAANHETQMRLLQAELSEKMLRRIKISTAAESLSNLEKAEKSAQSDFLNWKSAYEEFVCGQAYFLSLELRENTPCPVCGSTSHPSPAVAKSTNVITKSDLDKLQKEQEKSRKLLEKAHQNSHECMVALELETDNFTQAFLRTMLEDISAQIKDLNDKLNGFTSGNLSPEKLAELVVNLTSCVSADSAKLAEITAKISSNNLDEQDLLESIKVIKSQIESSEKALKSSSIILEKARKEHQNLTSQFAQNSVLAKKYSEEESLHSADYKILLQKYKLSESELLKLSEKLLQLDSMQKKIEKHNKELAAFTQAVDSGKSEFEGKTAIDLVALKQKIDEYSAEYNIKTKEYEAAIKSLDSNSKVLKKLKKLEDEFDVISESFSQIEQLYKVSNGLAGDRISFERYVLRTYFELVVNCASDRLFDMTNGRYSMRRRETKEGGNTSSGLDLEVFDANCGKFRHVNSLSGGEGFKASLCLALGLADVISQKSGGILLDTIFIDEGFGTLDPAALDNAIECLYSLKNRGRTIGIISHVRELQEKIPVKLSVYQTGSGSLAEFN